MSAASKHNGSDMQNQNGGNNKENAIAIAATGLVQRRGAGG